MIFKATSGNIRCESTNGNTNFHTRSGNIRFENIGGNISAETTSGNMRCTVIEAGGNISLAATSGTININLPTGFAFNFQSETSSGSLSTPFSENLFSSIANRKLVQGVIGNASGAVPDNDIKIKTTSGSIKVKCI
jgi:DUF4097 and DUF4098 domain-containing protein YvlB